MSLGDGVFETLRVADGTPFALTRHLVRMASSARALGLPEVDVDRVHDHVLRLARDGAGTGQWPAVARLRLLWSVDEAGEGRLEVTHSPLPDGSGAVGVRTTSWRRNRAAAAGGHKSTDYVENLVALREGVALGAGEVLFADTAGNLSEGSGTNVFYVVDGELRTPALSTGCLPGITRALVLQWCGGAEVEEPLDVLARASEVFLTSSTREVQPVAVCDGWTYDTPGPVTRRVLETWGARSREWPDP